MLLSQKIMLLIRWHPHMSEAVMPLYLFLFNKFPFLRVIYHENWYIEKSQRNTRSNKKKCIFINVSITAGIILFPVPNFHWKCVKKSHFIKTISFYQHFLSSYFFTFFLLENQTLKMKKIENGNFAIDDFIKQKIFVTYKK